MALQKQDGGLGRILCGEIWRRCFASLAVTMMRRLSAMRRLSLLLLMDNFIQAAGIRDGASHCAKILSVE
jgi:hypothetical protein